MSDGVFQPAARRVNAARKLSVSLTAVATVALISAASPSFAAPSPLSSVPVAIQQGQDAAVPAELPELKTPEPSPAAKPAADDPLAWDAPPSTSAKAASDVPAMPAVKPAAVEKIEKIEKAEKAEKAEKVEKVEKAPSAEKAPGATSDKAATLEKRIEALEKQVATLHEKSLTRKDLEELETSVGALQQRIAEEKAAERQAAQQRGNHEDIQAAEPEKPKKARKAKVTQHRKEKKTPSRLTLSKRWVLKAAKPGTAWVAEKDSTSLRAVSVGDSLSGVGKIKSITKDSFGHWVVNGTSGRITQ